MTFYRSKEEVMSLALKLPEANVPLDAVEWVLSLESLDSLETSTSLATSAIGDVIAVSTVAFDIEVVAFAALAFFAGIAGELAFLAVLHLALSLHFLLFASAAVRRESMSWMSKS